MQTTGATDKVRSRQTLDKAGFVLFRTMTEKSVYETLPDFGLVIHASDVKVRNEAGPLVTSSRELGPHTDHHRVDAIAWHCIEQCEVGGETVLTDGWAAYELLAPEHRGLLETIQLNEHEVFPGDPAAHPLVTVVRGVPRRPGRCAQRVEGRTLANLAVETAITYDRLGVFSGAPCKDEATP